MLINRFADTWYLPPLTQAIGLVFAVILPWFLPIRFDHWTPTRRYWGYGFSFLSFVFLYVWFFHDGFRFFLESLDTKEVLIFSSESGDQGSWGRLVGIGAICINLILIAKWGDPETRRNMSADQGQKKNKTFISELKVLTVVFIVLFAILGIPRFFASAASTRVMNQGVLHNAAWELQPSWIPFSEIERFTLGSVTYISGPSKTGSVYSSGGGKVTEERITLLLKDGRELLVRESSRFDRGWVFKKGQRLAAFLQARGVALVPEKSSIQNRIEKLKIELPCPNAFSNCNP